MFVTSGYIGRPQDGPHCHPPVLSRRDLVRHVGGGGNGKIAEYVACLLL